MKADIFFFVTTIVVILLAIAVLIALYYSIRILRNVRDITGRVDEGSKALAEDFTVLRSSLRNEGFVWGHIISFLKKHKRWFAGKPSKSAKKD